MSYYTELPLSAQTAYAQLLDATLGSELSRTVAGLSGSFARKKVKERDYWYFQFTDLGGVLRQVYVGPDSERIQALVSEAKTSGQQAPLAPLARSAVALGCAPVLPRHFRVLRRLSEYGFFKAGGVLIGTHAFLAHGNMLGLHWGDTSRTQDVDLADAGKNMAIALPANLQVDAHGAIESLEMGLVPVISLSSKAGATYLNPRDPDFRLDFLTTLHRGKEAPYEHVQLHVVMQPLKFMEYLLQDLAQAALFCDEGSILVNVPNPARYALHKLLVFGERSASYAQKSRKDLQQAAALLEYHKAHRDWDVKAAWGDLVGRGRGWVSRAKQGVSALEKLAPELDIQSWLQLPKAARRKS